MSDPSPLEIDWFDTGMAGGPAEPNEPVTPGSGSHCPGFEGDWTLTGTSWHSFVGTGGPLVLRLEGDWYFGMVLYEAEGLPTADDGIACMYGEGQRRHKFDTTAGRRYLVQVGDADPAPDEAQGDVYKLSLARVAPNDLRSRPTPLPFGEPVHTSNFGATLENGEPTECAVEDDWTVAGDRSVWMRIDAPSHGSVLADLQPVDTTQYVTPIVAIFAAYAHMPFACSSETIEPATTGAQLAASVAPGPYWLQLTAREFSGDSFDTIEEFWRIKATFTPDLDVDRDGHGRPSDCRDDLPGIHPGAVEVLDNGVDENCDGRDDRRDSDADGVADYQDRCPTRPTRGVDRDRDGCRDKTPLRLTAQIRLTLDRGRLTVARLVVRAPKGSRVVLTCERRACKREVVRMRRNRKRLGRGFAPTIAERTVVSIRATKPGSLGVVKRYRLSSTGARLVGQWCLGTGKRPKRVPCE